MIETDSLAQYGYSERMLPITQDFIDFLALKYNDLKNEHTARGFYNGIDAVGNPAEYCPCVHFVYYNLFYFKHPFIYSLYKNIQEMTIEYCEKNGIDYKKQKYHIHGFFTYTKKEGIGEDWHDHGDNENHLHGFLPIDAEPSHTLYRIDGQQINLIAKNGRVIVGKNTMHTRATDWNEERPRVSVAFNIKPFDTMPDTEFYIPLL